MEAERTPSRRHKPEERHRVAELCERSGLSPYEFSKVHGISLSSLQRWLRELRALSAKEVPAVVFQEVAVSPHRAASDWVLEIVGPDGVTVRCRERLPVEELSLLLRGRPC